MTMDAPLKPSIKAIMCQSPNGMWDSMTNSKTSQCIQYNAKLAFPRSCNKGLESTLEMTLVSLATR